MLFADLSGFTALAERTDPEEIRSMVDRCMCAMGEVVEQFGGAVDKVIGDALMAVFGAPVAHEDDPTRAVRAALEIQRRASENAEEFCGLCVRVGVNTGEVIFARVGPEARRELTVMGDAVNTASRLQSAAPAEGVLVGEQTHAATAVDIEYEALAPLTAKGKSAPLLAWIARSATAAPAERRVSDAPLVGRETELELLARAWARTSTERYPQLITVVGAPGIGKTRLTLELARRIQHEGGRMLRGRSLPYGERVAYGALALVIKEACGILASDAAPEAVAKLTRRLRALLGDDDASSVATHLSIVARLTDDRVEEREDLFASVRRFLEALATEQPTLLVLEDLQWADQSLLELVGSLVVRLTDAPLLILALAREEFLDNQPGWARLPRHVTVQLDALGSAHANALARRLLPGIREDDSIVSRVERAAGGIRQPLDMLQQMQSHHQTDRQPGTSRFAVVRRKMRFQPRPVHQFAQPYQLMAQIDEFFSFELNSSCVPLSCGLTLGFIPSPQNKLQDFSTHHAKTLQSLHTKINTNRSFIQFLTEDYLRTESLQETRKALFRTKDQGLLNFMAHQAKSFLVENLNFGRESHTPEIDPSAASEKISAVNADT